MVNDTVSMHTKHNRDQGNLILLYISISVDLRFKIRYWVVSSAGFAQGVKALVFLAHIPYPIKNIYNTDTVLN